MRFKTNKIEFDWNESELVHDNIRALARMVDIFCKLRWGKDIMLTELIRTQEGQDKIYGDRHDYQKKPWKSLHQFGLAFDIRSRDFSPIEIGEIVSFANNIPYGEHGKKKTAIAHNVGAGFHIHFQWNWRKK